MKSTDYWAVWYFMPIPNPTPLVQPPISTMIIYTLSHSNRTKITIHPHLASRGDRWDFIAITISRVKRYHHHLVLGKANTRQQAENKNYRNDKCFEFHGDLQSFLALQYCVTKQSVEKTMIT
jgi:hypothetical protein